MVVVVRTSNIFLSIVLVYIVFDVVILFEVFAFVCIFSILCLDSS